MPGVEDLIGAGTSAAGGPIGMGINAVSSLASTGLGIAQFVEQKDQWNKQFEYMKDQNEHYYQNKVKDLRAAGLNPLLAAGSGFSGGVSQGPTQSPISTSGADARPSQQHDIYAKLNAQQMQAQTDKVMSDKSLVDEQIAAQHHRNVMDGVYTGEQSPAVQETYVDIDLKKQDLDVQKEYGKAKAKVDLESATLIRDLQQQVKELHSQIDPLMPANIKADTANKRALGEAATKNAATNQFTAEVNAKLTAHEIMLKKAMIADQLLRNEMNQELKDVNLKWEKAQKMLLTEDAEFSLKYTFRGFSPMDKTHIAEVYRFVKAAHPDWSEEQQIKWASSHLVLEGAHEDFKEIVKSVGNIISFRQDITPKGTPKEIKGFSK